MLIEPIMNDAPMVRTSELPASIAAPVRKVSRAWSVQPAAGAPPSMNKELASIEAPATSNPVRALYMGAHATTDAPIGPVRIQGAKPATGRHGADDTEGPQAHGVDRGMHAGHLGGS